MKSRIAPILLLASLAIMLLVIVPADAQEATEAAAITTVEPFTPLSFGAAAATPEALATAEAAAATASADQATAAAAAAEAEATATVEAAVPETHPVAGVPEATAAENPVPGATVLVLLAGVGAVGLVGFAAIMRESYKKPEE